MRIQIYVCMYRKLIDTSLRMPLLKVTDCARASRICVVAATVDELIKKGQY